jgi:Ca-activated chloride channel family protein
MAERPIVVFGKWRGEPRGQVVITGSTGAGEFRQSLDVGETAPDPAAGVLRYLWARARIADLSDACISPETEESKRALVSLGLTYNLLTRHTSFIAVHEAIVNPLADGEDVTQPLPLPAGVGNNAVGGVGVGVGDEPGLAALLAMLLALALVAGTCLWLRRQAEAAGR